MADHSTKVDHAFVQNSLAAAIQIGLLFLVAAWCIKIVYPFIGIVAWAAIIAIAIYPLHRKLAGVLGKREKLSAVIIVLIGLSILLIPTWSLTGSSIETSKKLATSLQDGTLQVPPPAEKVEHWPVVGKKVYKVWGDAADNLEATLNQYKEQVQAFSNWLLKSVADTALGILGFVASIIIVRAKRS